MIPLFQWIGQSRLPERRNQAASACVRKGVERRILLKAFAALVLTGVLAAGQAPPRTASVVGTPEDAGPRSRWMVLLEDAPVGDAVVDRSELRSGHAVSALRRVRLGQDRVRQYARSRRLPIVGSTHTLLNSITVMATRAEAADVATLPGVSRVIASEPVTRAGNRALGLVRAPEAWRAIGDIDKAGLGVKIGVIDTGIDQSHPAFSDTSLPETARLCRESTGDCAFTNPKVIAARSYVRMLSTPEYPEDSRPDDLSPRDRVGHGTAVAFLAAAAIHESPIGVIAGVAPKAYLGNYKVFGSPGVNDVTFTDVVAAALEDALYDGMDVVTLSLSFPAVFGPGDTAPGGCSGLPDGTACDPRVEYIQRAARLGLTCVVAAGNEGDSGQYMPSFNTIGSPGTTPEAITVGATTNAHAMTNSVAATGADVPEALKLIPALFGNGPKPAEPLEAALVDVKKLEDDGQACSPLPGGSLDGSIALIEAGGCLLRTKVTHAANAGAKAVLFMRGPGNNSIFSPQGLWYTPIPLILVGHDNGVLLREHFTAAPGRTVSLNPGFVEYDATDFADYAAYFSSQGPAIGTGGFKPDLVAPGTDLYAATQMFDDQGDMFDKSGYTAVQGTSFAVPLVAGAVALSRQFFPGLTEFPENQRAAILKSSVVNTADPEIYDVDSSGETIYASVVAMGSGKLDAESALATMATVSPATLSFGVLSDANWPVKRSLVFRNHSAAPLELSLSLERWTDDNLGKITITPSAFTLQAGAESEPVKIELGGQAPLPGRYEGVIKVGGAGAPFQIPFLYLVGDGVPHNIIPVRNGSFTGQVDKVLRGGLLFKVVDRYGVPVPNVPVQWRVVSGGGEITAAYPSLSDPRTDIYGIGEATTVWLGDRLGDQVFEAEIPVLAPLQFIGQARLSPVIESDGVVNAADGSASEGLAAGSMVSIRGRGLSEFTLWAKGPELPLSLGGVSVSLDAPEQGVQAPAHIAFVSDGRIDVQLPWELAGLAAAKLKVSLDGFTSTSLYAAKIAAASPALLQLTDSETGQRFPRAWDDSGQEINSVNRARRGSRILLLANGLGAVENQPESGKPALDDPPSILKAELDVTVGGRAASVESARLMPGRVADYEIILVVPGDLPAGERVQSLQVTVNGISSKTVNLPITD